MLVRTYIYLEPPMQIRDRVILLSNEPRCYFRIRDYMGLSGCSAFNGSALGEHYRRPNVSCVNTDG